MKGARPGLVWSVMLALIMLAPLLMGRGIALVGDMVFVPEQPWKPAWLGADGSVPRAVPSDALVSLLTQVLPGDLLQKLILVGVIVGAGWGVARLLKEHGALAQMAAVSVYVWNPFVYERLAIGHWALLCGYAVLPWVVMTARRVRDEGPGALPGLVLPLAIAAWTSPTGGVLAALTAMTVVLGRPRWATAGLTAAVAAFVNAPWIVPGLLAEGALGSDAAGVAAFAARADTPYGTLLSVATLGGIWKSSVVAPGRESLLLSGMWVVLGVVALIGLRWFARRDLRLTLSLAALGVFGLAVAWFPTTQSGGAAFEWLVAYVPGAGLLRDSQKWVAPAGLLWAVGLSAFVERSAKTPRPSPRTTAAVGILVLPLVTMPGLVWGQLGRLAPVSYPAEWSVVARVLDTAGGDRDRVVVLPFEIYHRFGWNDDRAVLDPAPRYFPGDVIVNDVLRVDRDVAIVGEDPIAAAVAAGLERGSIEEVLDAHGVRWVVVHKNVPGSDDVLAPRGSAVHEGRDLILIDRGLPAEDEGARPQSAVVYTADALAVALLTGSLVIGALRWRARR